MGAEESTPYNNREYKSLLANYYRRKSYDDPRYGQCSIWSHNHNPDDTLLVKEKWTNTKQEADNLNDLVHTRRSNNSKNLAKYGFFLTKKQDLKHMIINMKTIGVQRFSSIKWLLNIMRGV